MQHYVSSYQEIQGTSILQRRLPNPNNINHRCKRLRVKALVKNKQGYEAAKHVNHHFLLVRITETTQSIIHLKNGSIFSETTAPIQSTIIHHSRPVSRIIANKKQKLKFDCLQVLTSTLLQKSPFLRSLHLSKKDF